MRDLINIEDEIRNIRIDQEIGRRHLDAMFTSFCKAMGDVQFIWESRYYKVMGAVEIMFYSGVINGDEFDFITNSIREVRDCFA